MADDLDPFGLSSIPSWQVHALLILLTTFFAAVAISLLRRRRPYKETEEGPEWDTMDGLDSEPHDSVTNDSTDGSDD